MRMLGYQGPAQPSPALGDALNAGYHYLEVRCLGCNTHQTVPLNIVRRPKATPIHEPERYMRCKDCSEVRGYPYKRSSAADEDFGRSPGVDMVAGGAVKQLFSRTIRSYLIPLGFGLMLHVRSCATLGAGMKPPARVISDQSAEFHLLLKNMNVICRACGSGN